jgi:hypothetical protein
VRRKIDPSDARAYLLSLKPPGKKCALRVIAAFDKLQQGFEQTVGWPALTNVLGVIRAPESLRCA